MLHTKVYAAVQLHQLVSITAACLAACAATLNVKAVPSLHLSTLQMRKYVQYSS